MKTSKDIWTTADYGVATQMFKDIKLTPQDWIAILVHIDLVRKVDQVIGDTVSNATYITMQLVLTTFIVEQL